MTISLFYLGWTTWGQTRRAGKIVAKFRDWRAHDRREGLQAVHGVIMVDNGGRTEPVVVELRLPCEADLDAIVAMEISSYPEDEAASPEALRYRLRVAGNCLRPRTQSYLHYIVALCVH